MNLKAVVVRSDIPALAALGQKTAVALHGCVVPGVIARGVFRLIIADAVSAVQRRHTSAQLMAWPLLPTFVKQSKVEPIGTEVRAGSKLASTVTRHARPRV